MKKTAIFWILVLTIITSLFLSIGIALTYSGNSVLRAIGNYLLVSRLWQLVGIPILIYFLIRKMPINLLIIPLILIILIAWVFVEPALNWPLGADLRNFLYILVNVALAAYSTILLTREKEKG